jgi:hypothetical protein
VLLALILCAAPLEPMSNEQLARADAERLSAELVKVDAALPFVQPVPLGQVFAKAGERGGVFLAIGMIPGLAVGLLVAAGGRIPVTDQLAVILATPVIIAAGVGLFAFVGSLLEHLFVEAPERSAQRERLNAYRATLEARREHR